MSPEAAGLLISGASDGKIDVEDMRSHTCYVGGYSVLDRNVNRFWSVVYHWTASNRQLCYALLQAVSGRRL
jgi:hypothetical protein